MNQYSELLYFLKGLAEDNQFVNTVTKGSVDKIDLEKANIYPLFHIDINDAGFTNGSTITFEVTLTCLTQRDINKEIVEDDKFWSNDNEVDNHNETLAILNDVWLRILRDWQDRDITTEDNATLQKIEFSKGNILDGWSLAFTVELPNTTISLCDGAIDLGYGYLYNWYTVEDSRNIANDGWHVPTREEQNELSIYLGGGNVAGGKIKEEGLTFWNFPNIGATNESGFGARGGGVRGSIFDAFGTDASYWSIDSIDDNGYRMSCANGSTILNTLNFIRAKIYGLAVRLVKDTTTLSDGETGFYTGNDGQTCETICIGSQEWTMNIKETKYRDGSEIPTVTDQTDWDNLTTGAKCAYNNDESNV